MTGIRVEDTKTSSFIGAKDYVIFRVRAKVAR